MRFRNTICITVLSVLFLGSGMLHSEAGRMSAIQYARFLDDLEETLPAVSIRIASLCGSRPAYGLTAVVSNSVVEALDSCENIVPGLLKDIQSGITSERRAPKISTEYVIEYQLRGVIQTASDVSRLATRDINRNGEAMTITEKLQPLDLQLYSHILAVLREWDGPPSK